MKEKKTPLIRLAKRDGLEGWKVWCIRACSILLALALGALAVAVTGANPLQAYGAIVTGALGKPSAIRQTPGPLRRPISPCSGRADCLLRRCLW